MSNTGTLTNLCKWTSGKEHAEEQSKNNCYTVLHNCFDTKENLYTINAVLA